MPNTRTRTSLTPTQPLATINLDELSLPRILSSRQAALTEERGRYLTPYDLKHARVTAWLDESANVLGVRFLTGTKLALDRYAHASRRAAESVIGWHSGREAREKECEGEDLNLHGSYPASTSS